MKCENRKTEAGNRKPETGEGVKGGKGKRVKGRRGKGWKR